MKILFLCGSLEPGKDGVGDYTRRLSGELLSQNQEISILAINDRYIKDISVEEQKAGGFKIPILRLPEVLSSKERSVRAHEWVDLINPEILSLQFVAFSFHRKGLPWGIQNDFYRLGKGREWHVMFHELWVDGNTFINAVWSQVQQEIIFRILKKLKPVAIHTHVPVYLQRLEKFNFRVRALPIFSNVHSSEKKLKEKSHFTIGFFSQFGIPGEVFRFLELLIADLIERQVTINILLIGECGKKKKNLQNRIVRKYKDRLRILCTGFLEAEKVASLIKKCDVGMTPVPRHLLGKSGSVAAFLSNGIPVAAPYVKPNYEKFGIGFFENDLCSSIVTKPDLRHVQISAVAAQSAAIRLDLSRIAQKFMRDIC